MAKRIWTDVINKAVELCKLSLEGKVCYIYGAKGVWLKNEAHVRQYFAQEPGYFSKYSDEEKNQIVRNSVGKYAGDCSNFTGECTGDKQWSIGQINNCYKYNSLAAGPTASLLFTSFSGVGRHIGLDVGGTGRGQGLCMHMGWESTDANVRAGLSGVVFEPIANRPWERSGQSNLVDYAGVYSPYAPVLELWDKLHPNPSPTPTFNGWVGEIYGKNLVQVYSDASGSRALQEYPALALGNLFEVIGEQGNRWKIKIANKYVGWLDKQYCLRKTAQKQGRVTTDLWMRTSPNAKIGTNKVTIMPSGATVQICDAKPAADGNEWYHIIYGGQYGFCSAKYVK